MQETESQIETYRLHILEAVKNLKQSNYVSLNGLRRRANDAESQIRMLPEKEKQEAAIRTQLDSRVGIAKFLLEQREITSMSLASVVTNSTIIDQATPSGIPIKPDPKIVHIVAFLIGLGLPALIIFIIEATNDKITTRYDIEKITSAPVLGEVGHSYSEYTLVVRKNYRGMVAEQFRIIRSNLQYILNKIEKPVILVTSSFSGEGKSFISTNLGAVMALAGKNYYSRI